MPQLRTFRFEPLQKRVFNESDFVSSGTQPRTFAESDFAPSVAPLTANVNPAADIQRFVNMQEGRPPQLLETPAATLATTIAGPGKGRPLSDVERRRQERAQAIRVPAGMTETPETALQGAQAGMSSLLGSPEQLGPWLMSPAGLEESAMNVVRKINISTGLTRRLAALIARLQGETAPTYTAKILKTIGQSDFEKLPATTRQQLIDLAKAEGGEAPKLLAKFTGVPPERQLLPPEAPVTVYTPARKVAEEAQVTLYRVEPTPGLPSEDAPAPDWAVQGNRESGAEAATGRWYASDNPEQLDWYRREVGPNARIVKITVPRSQAERWRVSNLPEDSPARRFSRDPENEFFLPEAPKEMEHPPQYTGEPQVTPSMEGPLPSVREQTMEAQYQRGLAEKKMEAGAQAMKREFTQKEVEASGLGKELRAKAEAEAVGKAAPAHPEPPPQSEEVQKAFMERYYPGSTEHPSEVVTANLPYADALQYAAHVDEFLGGRTVINGFHYAELPAEGQQFYREEASRLRGQFTEASIRRAKAELARRPAAAQFDPLPPPGVLNPEGSYIPGFARYRNIRSVLNDAGASNVVDPLVEGVRLGDRFQSFYDRTSQGILTRSSIKPGSKDATDIGHLLNFEDVPEASENAKAAAMALRTQFFDPIIQTMNDPAVAKVVGQAGYIQGYFPYFVEKETRQFGKDAAIWMLRDRMPKSMAPSIFRPRAGGPPDIEYDIFEILPKYVSLARRGVYDLPAYQAAKEAAQTVPAGEVKRWADWYADNYIGQPSARALPNEQFDKLSNFVSNRFYDLYLSALNPKASGLNLLQTALNTYPEIGAEGVVSGARQLWTPEGRKLVADAGIYLDYPGLERLGKASARDLIHTPFRAAEYFNRGVAYLGARGLGLKRGMSVEAAERYAYGIVNTTQFASLSEAPIRGVTALNEAFPAGGQFASYVLNDADFIRNLFRNAIGGTPHAKAKLGRFLLMSTAIASGGIGAVLNLPGLAPSPRNFLDLMRYIGQVANGRRDVADLPQDAIKAIEQQLPRSIRPETPAIRTERATKPQQ